MLLNPSRCLGGHGEQRRWPAGLVAHSAVHQCQTTVRETGHDCWELLSLHRTGYLPQITVSTVRPPASGTAIQASRTSALGAS